MENAMTTQKRTVFTVEFTVTPETAAEPVRAGDKRALIYRRFANEGAADWINCFKRLDATGRSLSSLGILDFTPFAPNSSRQTQFNLD
jgi:hypothetical protein